MDDSLKTRPLWMFPSKVGIWSLSGKSFLEAVPTCLEDQKIRSFSPLALPTFFELSLSIWQRLGRGRFLASGRMLWIFFLESYIVQFFSLFPQKDRAETFGTSCRMFLGYVSATENGPPPPCSVCSVFFGALVLREGSFSLPSALRV